MLSHSTRPLDMKSSPKATTSMPFSWWLAKSMPLRCSRAMLSALYTSSSKLKRKLNCHVGHSSASSPFSSAKVMPSWISLSRSTLLRRVWQGERARAQGGGGKGGRRGSGRKGEGRGGKREGGGGREGGPLAGHTLRGLPRQAQ